MSLEAVPMEDEIEITPNTTLSVLVMSIQTLSVYRHEWVVMGVFFRDVTLN
jgi:hypothetical protein